ncbi:hypothetical protein C8F04DRAFT_1185996 [Mycena alexandri]|uniref:NADP-dependent oxidoreductase domain-containing protein n=1 Tax=Mycena alexandri TaxID=1745969 RepID=A0AAD6SP77_9AGAR|nr:hypothetical protein C8F04DRAFT_1185996 [Mycena alexandri]
MKSGPNLVVLSICQTPRCRGVFSLRQPTDVPFIAPYKDYLLESRRNPKEARGISMTQVSIAWMLSKEAAIHIKLTQEEIEYLEKPYRPVASSAICELEASYMQSSHVW